MKPRLLVVDDEPIIHEIVSDCVEGGHEVLHAWDTASGLAALSAELPDVLLTDLRMPGGGLALVEGALSQFPDLAVVVMTGYGTVDDFVLAFRMGIADFVTKPFTPSQLRRSLERALVTRRLRAENVRLLAEERASGSDADALLGASPAIVAVREAASRVAPTHSTVLVSGASGTGKELVARMVHAQGRRASGPFVAVHCGALSESLLESELFGHVRGAFTNAHADRAGKFEEASGGTLFLDEVGTMTPATQVRLLRALSSGAVTRVGADAARPVDVRVVAATNVDLAALVRAGSFRADLHYRLNVFPIVLPTLAERRTDIPLLARVFLQRACVRQRRPPLSLSQDAMRRLVAHRWPGNVRELENVMERAAIVATPGGVVEADDLLLAPGTSVARSTVKLPEEGLDLPAYLASVEADLIRQALERSGSNRQQAAALLRVHRSTLAQKLRRGTGGAAHSDGSASPEA